MDIAAAILEIAQNGAIKTQIIYRAFLSYPQLRDYLELLQARGMLVYDEHQNEYYTTDEGKRFVQMYKELGKMLPKDNILKTIS